jgi:hypothetical protein
MAMRTAVIRINGGERTVDLPELTAMSTLKDGLTSVITLLRFLVGGANENEAINPPQGAQPSLNERVLDNLNSQLSIYIDNTDTGISIRFL